MKTKKIKLPRSVKQLRLSKKKWAKKNGMDYTGKKLSKGDKKVNKKRVKKKYPVAVAKGLNKAVQVITENPNSDKIDKINEAINGILTQPKLMAKVAKVYKEDRNNYDELIYLPRIILTTIQYYERSDISPEEKAEAENMDVDALTEFCEKILTKPRKKYESFGLSQSAAFALAALIPDNSILRGRYWYRRLVHTLYEIAESEVIDFDKVIEAISKLNKKHKMKKDEIRRNFFEEYIFTRKTNRFKQFTKTQNDLHEDLQNACLKYLDKLKKKEIKGILEEYVKRRKKAEKEGKDGSRIFKFIDHANSNSPFENIKWAVGKIITDHPEYETYLG